jgi:UDP-glucose 6-dehydrogenase
VSVENPCDISQVKNAIKENEADIYIIKSTVLPMTTLKLQKEFNKTIIFSPEYYGGTQHCNNFKFDFTILGGVKWACVEVQQLLQEVYDARHVFRLVDSNTAELVKYMENCWIATKVTFCNEFARIANAYGISYNELRELWIADGRVSPSHTFVYPETPYYDSHCLNKDIPALISFCKENHIATPLMKSVNEINMLSHLLNDYEEEVEY